MQGIIGHTLYFLPQIYLIEKILILPIERIHKKHDWSNYIYFLPHITQIGQAVLNILLIADERRLVINKANK